MSEAAQRVAALCHPAPRTVSASDLGCTRRLISHQCPLGEGLRSSSRSDARGVAAHLVAWRHLPSMLVRRVVDNPAAEGSDEVLVAATARVVTLELTIAEVGHDYGLQALRSVVQGHSGGAPAQAVALRSSSNVDQAVQQCAFDAGCRSRSASNGGVPAANSSSLAKPSTHPVAGAGRKRQGCARAR